MNAANHISVVVVVICGGAKLENCLRALLGQQCDTPIELIVAHSVGKTLGSAKTIAERALFVSQTGCDTPMHLAALGIRNAGDGTIVLTEDHCLPGTNWVQQLSEALTEGRGAVGGPILLQERLGALDWAFVYVDFFNHLLPVPAGRTNSLSSCNAAYRRADLLNISGCWESIFHETVVHETLTRTAGPLWRVPEAAVTVGRKVTLRAALRERYQLGRLYGAKRASLLPKRKAFVLALASPGLPLLLGIRHLTRALQDAKTLRQFTRSFPHWTALVLAWSWGECLGYLTRNSPASVDFAPETPYPGQS